VYSYSYCTRSYGLPGTVDTATDPTRNVPHLLYDQSSIHLLISLSSLIIATDCHSENCSDSSDHKCDFLILAQRIVQKPFTKIAMNLDRFNVPIMQNQSSSSPHQSCVQSSRLQALAEMQAALALQNQQKARNRKLAMSQPVGLGGLSGASGLDMAALQQRMAMEEQARTQAQFDELERSRGAGFQKSPLPNFGSEKILSIHLSDANSSLLMSNLTSKRRKISLDSQNARPSIAGRHVASARMRIPPKSQTFPLPSLRSNRKFPRGASLNSYRIAWGTMCQRSSKFDEYTTPTERRTLLKEGFGKAILMNKIELYIPSSSSSRDLVNW
jgi:hypothetical protein